MEVMTTSLAVVVAIRVHADKLRRFCTHIGVLDLMAWSRLHRRRVHLVLGRVVLDVFGIFSPDWKYLDTDDVSILLDAG